MPNRRRHHRRPAARLLPLLLVIAVTLLAPGVAAGEGVALETGLAPPERLALPHALDALDSELGALQAEAAALRVESPEIARHLLGQELELPSVASWWCGQPTACSHVLANLGQLLIKPIYREVGSRVIDASRLSELERDQLKARISARPQLFVGQERIGFSTVPTLVKTGLEARQAVLRSFLVARKDGYVVMPGGLTRVAPSQDNFDVSGQAGGLSKDTWILASEPEKQVSLLPTSISGVAALPRIVTVSDISIMPKNSKDGGGLLAMNLTAKTYRYMEEDERAPEDETPKKKGKKGKGKKK